MTSTSQSHTRTSPAPGTSPAAEKLAHPAKEFSDPAEVLTDCSLSPPEKLVALNSLEQDARQLAVAAAEGMAGGEQTKLRNILQAERSLELPSSDLAFTTVLRIFEEQRRKTRGTDTDVLITRAIEAITVARDAIMRQAVAPVPPPGAPKPGSKAELQEELNKEKLDPGA
jgi:hypothetical protein